MKTRTCEIKGKIKQFPLSLVITVCLFSILLSLLTRLTDFFFISSSVRYTITLGLLLFSALFLFFIGKILNNKPLQIKQVLFGYPANVFFIIANLFLSVILVLYIPKPKIPINHTLIISVLPSGHNADTSIQINRIRKQIDAPKPGSAYIDLEELKFEGGDYQFSEDRLYLGENATARYDSFFSGCISIFFNTSPESHLVDVQFDQIKERYSLFNANEMETEVQLCAPISIQRLSPKWQLIIFCLSITDFFSLFSFLCSLEIIVHFLFFSKSETIKSSLQTITLVFFFGITIFGSITQIYQIWQFPEIHNKNLPPLKPSVFSEGVDFRSIYQKTFQTKKFAHAFILSFLDIYPRLEQVYIDQKTLEAFNFNSFEFQRWFSVYDPQPALNMPIKISDNSIIDWINSEHWVTTEFTLEERGKTFYMNYSLQRPDEFVFITNIGNNFYLIPDSFWTHFEKGYSCSSK